MLWTDGHAEGCYNRCKISFVYTNSFLPSLSPQEEIFPVLSALRCVRTRWAAFNEAKGEVWIEETAGTMVFNTRRLQVIMPLGI